MPTVAPGPASSSSSSVGVEKDVAWQNEILAHRRQSLESEFSTDSARARFINSSLSYYYFVNFYLFVIYVVLGLVVMYGLLFRLAWNAALKFLVLVVVALYPFLIGIVEYGVRYVVSYVYSLYTGSIHLDPYYEHQPASISSIFSFSSLI